MKTNKILIILGLFLLPVLLNAQATKEKTNKVITQISDDSVTFTIPDIALDSTDIVNIQNKIQQEIKKVEAEKIQKQAREEMVKKNLGKIAAIYPSIDEEPLQKIVTNLAEMNLKSYYFNYYDAKYYEKAELNIELYTGDKTKHLTFDNSIFFFYESSNYDEGFSWNEWMILVYDTNTGDLKYKHDFSTNDKNITLTNLLNPEEKSVYKNNFR